MKMAVSKHVEHAVGNGEIAHEQFLAPLAVGQRAYIMVRCPLCVRPCIRLGVNFFFKLFI